MNRFRLIYISEVNLEQNEASVSAVIYPSAPTPPAITWYFNGVPANDHTFTAWSTETFSLRYDSVNANACDLYAEKGPYPGTLASWYSVPNFYNAYDWGLVQLPPYQYRWTVTCTGIGGTTVQYLHLIVPN